MLDTRPLAVMPRFFSSRPQRYAEGTFMNWSRCKSPSGFRRQISKYSDATLSVWHVWRCPVGSDTQNTSVNSLAARRLHESSCFNCLRLILHTFSNTQSNSWSIHVVWNCFFFRCEWKTPSILTKKAVWLPPTSGALRFAAALCTFLPKCLIRPTRLETEQLPRCREFVLERDGSAVIYVCNKKDNGCTSAGQCWNSTGRFCSLCVIPFCLDQTLPLMVEPSHDFPACGWLGTLESWRNDLRGYLSALHT